jgi:hypothetical protein
MNYRWPFSIANGKKLYSFSTHVGQNNVIKQPNPNLGMVSTYYKHADDWGMVVHGIVLPTNEWG